MYCCFINVCVGDWNFLFYHFADVIHMFKLALFNLVYLDSLGDHWTPRTTKFLILVHRFGNIISTGSLGWGHSSSK